MNFTVTTLAQSLADYLAPVLPGVTMYEDPNQQGTDTPCMFLQIRYSPTEKQLDGRFLRKLGVDLVYLEDFNIPDLRQKYLSAAQELDLVMDTFPYSDGEGAGTVLVRTYDREWTIEEDALHYKFELQERVSIQATAPKMKRLEVPIIIHVKEAEYGDQDQNG